MNNDERFALTDLQRAYYTAYSEKTVPTYIIKKIYMKNADPERLRRAVRELIAYYDILRCRMYEDGTQEVIPFDESIADECFEMISLTEDSSYELEKRLGDEERRLCLKRGEPENPRLFTALLVMLPDGCAYLYLKTDGLITDGKSADILASTLDRIYCGCTRAELPDIPSYRAYCESREREAEGLSYVKSRDYWKAEMERFAEPFTLPMLEGYEKRGHSAAIELKASLTREDSEKISRAARRNGISETALKLAAFCKTAELYNENDSFQVNIPYDKRLSAEYENIFGECADYYIYKYERRADESVICTAKRINSELKEISKFLAFSGNEITSEYMRYTQDYQSTFFPVVYTDLCELTENDTDELEVVDMFSHTSGIWLDAVLYRTAGEIRINLDSNEGLFRDGFLEDFLSSFVSTLKEVENWDNIFNAYLPSGEEEFLRKFNDTAEERKYVSYSEMIEKSIALRRREMAVYTEDSELSYEAFYSCVRDISAYISGMNIIHERIAVILGKGLDVLLWAQAIVLSGNVYVPLDCDYPTDTMNRCLSLLGAKKIVTNNEFMDKLSGAVNISANDIINTDESDIPMNCGYKFVECGPMDKFAIIHTSGSTGLPKAVELTHAGILNTLVFSVEKFEISSDDKILALTNHCHDMSLFDMFGMFIAGGAVSVIEHFHWQDPYVWAEQIKQYHLTLWNSVPSIMDAFLDIIGDEAKDVLDSLRLVIHGGEAIPIAEVRKLEILAEKSRLLSVGGPTETSIWSIYHFAEENDADKGIIPYGVPISNMKYRLLNKNGIDVPFNVRGTMFVSGIGTAEGYIDGRDSGKFVIDKTGTLWYDTGDLGVYDRNGYIVFSGRADNQIKRFGKRIELDGIERTAMNFCGIARAKVLIDECNSDMLLYYSADEEKSTEQMRSALSEHLPEYMVPQYYIFVKNMPLTHNGKIDSKQLRKMMKNENRTDDKISSSYTADSGFREFADIVRKSLGIERNIVPDDNFFMCGGTSLKAMKLSAEIKKHYGKSVNLRTFFIDPVIGDLYKAVSGTAEKQAAVSDENGLTARLPLTYLQQFIFLSELMNKTVEKFVLTAYSDYDEIFNEKVFRKACMLVWEKHRSLHYKFAVDSKGEPYQVFSEEKCNYREIISVKECDDPDSEVAELSKWHPDIMNARNGRIVLLENRAKNVSRIVITLHHAVSDERTFSIIFAEIEDVYRSILRENKISKLAYDNEFAAYTIEKNKKKYEEISVAGLPKTVKMPGADTDSKDGEMIILEKDMSSLQALASYCSAKGTTEFMGFLATAIISFSALTGNVENGFVIPLSERYDYDMPNAAGIFVDEYLLNFKLSKGQTFGEVLSEVDKAYIQMLSNGADPYREALKKRGLLDDFYKNRTYYPYFSYFESTSEKGRDMDFYEKQNDSETELMFMIKKSSDKYTLMLSYKNSFCRREEAEKLADLFGRVLDLMVDSPDKCVDEYFDTHDSDIAEASDVLSEETGAEETAQIDDTIGQVKAAWEEVLNRKCDDHDVNFFDAGGYSFLLYQLSSAVNRHTGRKIPFIALMTYPTINSLAEYIEELSDEE